MFVLIRDDDGNIRTLFAGGSRYYFRVLLPLLIIFFGVMLIFTLVMVTFGLIGATANIGLVSAISFGFIIPILILTFFSDTAAVFDDTKVFDSIRRSIQLVMTHISDVIAFLLVCAAISTGIIFMLMIIWEAFLYDKLEPITRYNETQLQTLTPDQLIALVGPEGMWITAIILFIGVFLLLPLLFTYKACFFRKLAHGAAVVNRETTGEYDSKGRWYKY